MLKPPWLCFSVYSDSVSDPQSSFLGHVSPTVRQRSTRPVSPQLSLRGRERPSRIPARCSSLLITPSRRKSSTVGEHSAATVHSTCSPPDQVLLDPRRKSPRHLRPGDHAVLQVPKTAHRDPPKTRLPTAHRKGVPFVEKSVPTGRRLCVYKNTKRKIDPTKKV